jgi:hypothetical protein
MIRRTTIVTVVPTICLRRETGAFGLAAPLAPPAGSDIAT